QPASSALIRLFLFTDPPTAEIYTLSLHDALPIFVDEVERRFAAATGPSPSIGIVTFNAQQRSLIETMLREHPDERIAAALDERRSEEHTSELQSRENLVCRLLLEKKKQQHTRAPS